MTSERAKKLLGDQLELLAEQSKGDTLTVCKMAQLSETMLSIQFNI